MSATTATAPASNPAGTPRLIDELDALHRSYVYAINDAVAMDDHTAVDELAAAYDTEATRLVAEREGLTHLLPLRRRTAA